jgi:hypothetical protein
MEPTKHELLQFCMQYPKRLSTEFIRIYCGFKTEVALNAYAREYGISLNQRSKN